MSLRGFFARRSEFRAVRDAERERDRLRFERSSLSIPLAEALICLDCDMVRHRDACCPCGSRSAVRLDAITKGSVTATLGDVVAREKEVPDGRVRPFRRSR